MKEIDVILPEIDKGIEQCESHNKKQIWIQLIMPLICSDNAILRLPDI